MSVANTIDLVIESMNNNAELLRRGTVRPEAVAGMIDAQAESLKLIREVVASNEGLVDRFTKWLDRQRQLAATPV